MNTLRNSVKLIGRIGQDPEVRSLDGGKKVATFSLATNESYTQADGTRRETTQWHNVVVWGHLAGLCGQYLHKGREIALEGRLSYRNWEDKNGSKHVSTDIIADEVLFVGNGNHETQN